MPDGPDDNSSAAPAGGAPANSTTTAAPASAAPDSSTTAAPLDGFAVDAYVTVDPDDGTTQHEQSVQVAMSAKLTLNWTATAADSVSISDVGDGLALVGTHPLETKDATYTVYAVTASGTKSVPVVITVTTHADGDVVSPHSDLSSGTAAVISFHALQNDQVVTHAATGDDVTLTLVVSESTDSATIDGSDVPLVPTEDGHKSASVTITLDGSQTDFTCEALTGGTVADSGSLHLDIAPAGASASPGTTTTQAPDASQSVSAAPDQTTTAAPAQTSTDAAQQTTTTLAPTQSTTAAPSQSTTAVPSHSTTAAPGDLSKGALLAPWKPGQPMTGPSSFHVVSQIITGAAVHGGGGGDLKPSGDWSWTQNGCGPATTAGSMRWFAEQGLTQAKALLDLVADESQRGDARAYMRLLFPSLDGQVPYKGSPASCDHNQIHSTAASYMGLTYSSLSLSTPQALAGFLQNGPVIITLKKPSHFVTIHGVVIDGSDATVWIGDNGHICQGSWGLDASQTGVGAPAGYAPIGYLGITWEMLKQYLNSAAQFHA